MKPQVEWAMRSVSGLGDWHYVSNSEDLANLFAAIMTLRALPWLAASAHGIRAFRVEQWSDFTKLVKGT